MIGLTVWKREGRLGVETHRAPYQVTVRTLSGRSDPPIGEVYNRHLRVAWIMEALHYVRVSMIKTK